MKKLIAYIGILTMFLLTSSLAHAQHKKISDQGKGAIIGGAGGAVVGGLAGHSIAKSDCSYHRHYSYRHGRRGYYDRDNRWHYA